MFMTEEPKSLIKINGQDMVSAESRLPSRESVDLATARVILQAVVDTHENTFTEGSDLTRAGSYDIEQIRQALALVSQDIMQTRGVNQFGRSHAEKQTPHGILSLVVRHRLYKKDGSRKFKPLDVLEEPLDTADGDKWDFLEGEGIKTGKPAFLKMYLTAKNDDRVLLSELPLEDVIPAGLATSVGFYDYRDGGRMVSMYDYTYGSEGFSIDGFKHMWRGLRWVSTNMLNWNEDFKLPEDLDKSLPLGINPPLLK